MMSAVGINEQNQNYDILGEYSLTLFLNLSQFSSTISNESTE